MECNKGSWRHFKSRNVNPRWYEQRNGTTECEILNGMEGEGRQVEEGVGSQITNTKDL